jgi:hypothetical protein
MHIPNGYHFAINSDIAMFRIYVNYEAKYAWPMEDVPTGINEELLIDINRISSGTISGSNSNGSNNGKAAASLKIQTPKLMHLSSTNSIANLLVFFTTSDDVSDNSKGIPLYATSLTIDKLAYATSQKQQQKNQNILLDFDEEVVSALALSSTNTLIQALPLTTTTTAATNDNSTMILLMNSQGTVVLTESEKGVHLITNTQLVQTDTIIYDLQMVGNRTKICGANDNDLDTCYFLLSYHTTTSILTISSVLISTTIDMSHSHTHSDSSSGVTSMTVKVIQSIDILRPFSTSINTNTITAGQLVWEESSQQLLLFIALNDIIYGTLLSTWSSAVRTPTMMMTTPTWIRISVGRNFDISMNNDRMLMLMTDYGYCYNSHDHNTRAYPSVCATIPTATEHTLDYSVGLWEDWNQVLSTSPCAATSSNSNIECFAVTSCSREILHGSYDLGSKPTVLVLPKLLLSNSTAYSINEKEEEEEDQSMFIEVHEGFSASARYLGGCGEALRREGLVIDSFRIDEWITTLQTRQ